MTENFEYFYYYLMHYLLWDVQHFGIHVQLANHKTTLCIQFIVFLSQEGENICVRCV